MTLRRASELLLVLGLMGTVRAESTPTSGERNRFFLLSLAEERYNWYSQQGYRLLGSGTQLGLGYGRYYSRAIVFGQLQAIIGPFPFHSPSPPQYEYQGIGAQLAAGVPFRGGDIRDAEHQLGPLLGLNYLTINGKALSGFSAPGVTISGVSLEGGLFYSWSKPPRPEGTTPDLLVTRLDGVLASLVCSVPLATKVERDRLWGTTLKATVHLLIGP